MSSYPKWLYHPTKGDLVVADEAAHKVATGEGWVESPADFPKAESKKTPPPLPVDAEPEDAEPVKPHKRK